MIYKITSLIDGRVYIGQTTTSDFSLAKRISIYRGDVRKYLRGKYLSRSKIIRAMAKYGFGNFSFEIIEKVESQEQLDAKEVFWISHYNSTDRRIGFNIQKGGWGVGKHSESSKRIMSEIAMGRVPHNKGKTGLLFGESIGTAKLTNEEAKDIREKRRSGRSVNMLMEEYGVSKPTILGIVNNVIYRDESAAKFVPSWYVYILRSDKDGSLYTGISLNVNERLKTHNDGRGARYTKSRRPFVLVFQEKSNTRSDALKREYEIKQFTREEKEVLIDTRGRLPVRVVASKAVAGRGEALRLEAAVKRLPRDQKLAALT